MPHLCSTQCRSDCATTCSREPAPSFSGRNVTLSQFDGVSAFEISERDPTTQTFERISAMIHPPHLVSEQFEYRSGPSIHSETMLSAIFVTDADGRLLHACDSGLRQLRLPRANWKGALWYSGLADEFQSLKDDWNARDPACTRVITCKAFREESPVCRLLVLAFEKSSDSSGYMASLKVVFTSLVQTSHHASRGGGRYEVAVFSVPDQRITWARSDGKMELVSVVRNVSWNEWLERILPDEREAVFARLNRLIDGRCEMVSLKFRVTAGDGRIEFLDCRFYSVLRDVSGRAVIVKVDALVSFGVGKSSLELHQGNQLLDHVHESVVATDLNGIIHYWGKGAEKLYGWTREEAIGKAVTMIVPQCEVKDQHERMRKVISDGSWSGRFQQSCKDGSTFLASSHISLVKDDDGNPIGFVGIDNDTTEWFAQQRQVTEMQTSLASAQWLSIRGELLAGCCHELCQPVFAIQNIISAVRRLLDLTPDSERVKQLLAMCSEEVTRAAEISEKLRGYATRPQDKLDQCDPRKLLEDCSAIGRLHAELAGVDFEIQIPKEPCEILCDQIQLRHVIINLLRNAFDSLNECDLSIKRVLLRGEVSDSDFIISVIDNGVGIAEHAREKLFSPFFTTKRNGTGVGLAMCRSIVATHGGKLTLVRSATYAGAHFDVALPRITR